MKKTIKLTTLITATALLLVMLVSLCACGSSKLVGTWKSNDSAAFFSSYTFNSDGTGSSKIQLLNTDTNFDYSEKSGKLELSENGKVLYTYEYTIDGDKLTLKNIENGSTNTYTKAK